MGPLDDLELPGRRIERREPRLARVARTHASSSRVFSSQLPIGARPTPTVVLLQARQAAVAHSGRRWVSFFDDHESLETFWTGCATPRASSACSCFTAPKIWRVLVQPERVRPLGHVVQHRNLLRTVAPPSPSIAPPLKARRAASGPLGAAAQAINIALQPTEPAEARTDTNPKLRDHAVLQLPPSTAQRPIETILTPPPAPLSGFSSLLSPYGARLFQNAISRRYRERNRCALRALEAT